MKQIKIVATILQSIYVKKNRRQVHISRKIIYPREGDVGWFDPVVIQPGVAGKPSAVMNNSTFYAYIESVQCEWPWRGVVSSCMANGHAAHRPKDPKPILKSIWDWSLISSMLAQAQGSLNQA